MSHLDRPSRRRSVPAQRRRRANQALLVLVPAAVLTGLFSNTIGTAWWPAPAAVHGIVALGLVALVPWKAVSVRRGIEQQGPRLASILLLATVILTLLSGLAHTTGLVRRFGPVTIMQLHVGGSVVALALLVVHYRRHPVPLRRTDFERRAFLRAAGVGLAGLVTWLSWEGVLRAVRSPGASRRFTGSHERGSLDPAAMPVTSWLDDEVQHLEAASWSLRVDDRVLRLPDLDAMPHDDLHAVLDCTSGWYSEQRWRGVRLDRLLSSGGRSISVVSATGYKRRFPVGDADNLWLVTSVGGRPLSAGHGFPARIVAPGRRRFWWVKWVTEIRTAAAPWWLQLPFPAS